MNIYLDNVKKEDKEILNRLLMYSLFEESLTDLNEMNQFALFEYPEFDNYFNHDNHKAFFIKEYETNKLLGFLMLDYFNDIHCIKEFMIIPKYRRLGIGKKVINLCFQEYKGNYIVTPSLGSKTAYLFWENIISLYTNNNYKYEDGSFKFKI